MLNYYYNYRPAQASRLSQTWNQSQVPPSETPTYYAMPQRNTPAMPVSDPMATPRATFSAYQQETAQLDPSMNTPANSPVRRSAKYVDGYQTAPRTKRSVSPVGYPRATGYTQATQQPNPHGLPAALLEFPEEINPDKLASYLPSDLSACLYAHEPVYNTEKVTLKASAYGTSAYGTSAYGTSAYDLSAFYPEAYGYAVYWTPQFDQYPDNVAATRNTLCQIWAHIQNAQNNPRVSNELRQGLETMAVNMLVRARADAERRVSRARDIVKCRAAHQYPWYIAAATKRFVEGVAMMSTFDVAKMRAHMRDWSWRPRS